MSQLSIMKWDSQKTANLIALLSLIAVVINFVCDKQRLDQQNKKDHDIEERSQMLTSLSLQPRLRLVGDPQIDMAILHFKPINVPYSDSLNQFLHKNVDSVETTIVVKTTLRFRNVGNHLARIKGDFTIDTPGYSPKIRSILLSESVDTTRFIVKPSFTILEIPVNDTVSFDFETELNGANNNADTIHYVILYENELGDYFDTYEWVPI
jgi:hypothetical protein